MIAARIMGGLGNQLFQYAAARRLAFHRNVPLVLDLSSYAGGMDVRPKELHSFRRSVALFNFHISATEATPEDLALCRDRFITTRPLHRVIRLLRRLWPNLLCPASHVREQSLAFDANVLELPDGTYLDGYRQSWKYFSDIASVIRKELQPRDGQLSQYADKYLSCIRASNGTVVSVHVRRGDLAHAAEVLGNTSIVQNAPLGLDYINAAMARFPSNTTFLIFSDSPKDIGWCQANIKGSNLAFSVNHSDIQDFILMSRCDHNIISNSTFSWWAAWLNLAPTRRVIAPIKWFDQRSRYIAAINDLMPSEWEQL